MSFPFPALVKGKTILGIYFKIREANYLEGVNFLKILSLDFEI